MSGQTQKVFLYGTLRYAPLLTVVAGEPISGQAATLPGFAIRQVAGETFPLVGVEDGGAAPGLLIEAFPEAVERIDFYEMGFGFAPAPVEIAVAGKTVAALAYLPEPGRWTGAETWSLDTWLTAEGPVSVAAAEEYMALLGRMDAEDAARLFPQIKMRAASRMRAQNTDKPITTGDVPRPSQVKIAHVRRPYVNYFGVKEEDLSFPRFDGGDSVPVTRAAFMGGDAVTVLPYDAATGRVLAVRQFRYGAYARGDSQPWCLEPIAGRIDPGESPEDAARREAREEAGLELGDLYPIGRYYPSPAAYSEFIYSFAAPADIAGRGGLVSGAEDEAEDIRSVILTLDELLGLIDTGEVDTGPLVISALWLARRRDEARRRH